MDSVVFPFHFPCLRQINNKLINLVFSLYFIGISVIGENNEGDVNQREIVKSVSKYKTIFFI